MFRAQQNPFDEAVGELTSRLLSVQSCCSSGLTGPYSQGDGREPHLGKLGVHHGKGEVCDCGFGRRRRLRRGAGAGCMRQGHGRGVRVRQLSFAPPGSGEVLADDDDGLQSAKDVVASLIKRLAHRNANVQLYTLEVGCHILCRMGVPIILLIMVNQLANALSQNCESKMHRELSSRSFTDAMLRLASERVRARMNPPPDLPRIGHRWLISRPSEHASTGQGQDPGENGRVDRDVCVQSRPRHHGAAIHATEEPE